MNKNNIKPFKFRSEYFGYFVTGWGGFQLVGFLFSAFPSSRMLFYLVITVLFIGATLLGVNELNNKVRNHSYLGLGTTRQKDIIFAFLPAILILILISLPLFAGIFIGL